MRAALAALLVASLSSCSVMPFDVRAGYEAVETPRTDEPAPMAELPAAAGKVAAVLQTEAHDVLTQRIVLKGDPDTFGENAIIVKVNEARGPWDIDAPVGLPTRAMIASELDQDFAAVDMQLSNRFERNSFGPFGYAVGRPTPRVTCVYAWQFGVWKWARLGEAPMGAPSMPLRPTSVRVRLCRSTLDEAQIVALLRQLQVFPPGSRLAYADPNYRGGMNGGDALAAAGVSYFVVPGATPAPSRERVEPPRKQRHRKTAHHRRHRRRTVEVEERAAVVDRPARRAVEAPMPSAASPSAAANPLLAPLSAPQRASADDMPLPDRLAPAERPTAPKSPSVPLPD
jgi:hypothetical protein